ncbi:MAG: glycerate kinase [Vicinamibacteria bacterium]
MLRAALLAARPAPLVAARLRVEGETLAVAGVRHRLGRGRVLVLAVGKAAAAMARAAERALGRHLDGGLAIDVSGRARPRRLPLLLAGHPVPDARGLRAARAAAALARGLGQDDLLLVLLSGGASALLPAPAEGISLADKARVTARLLAAGASIDELNVVRKHLSRLKGGGLARLAAPARVVCLALSDVVGDDLATIGSGPTHPDSSTFAEAIAILERRGGLELAPAAVRRHLEAGARGRRPETAKPGDACFVRVRTRVIGSGKLSLAAAAREARRLGLRTVVLTARLSGEAREVAPALLARLRRRLRFSRSSRPLCLLASGETTVTVRGRGRGGRNQELALAAVEPLARFPGPAVVATLATDGRDGHSDGAGAVVDDTTLARGRSRGLDEPAAALARNDSARYLEAVGDQVRTGPTGTNVADIVALLAAHTRKPR